MTQFGEVAERFKAAVLKTVEGLPPPRVRIPASPPALLYQILIDGDKITRGLRL